MSLLAVFFLMKNFLLVFWISFSTFSTQKELILSIARNESAIVRNLLVQRLAFPNIGLQLRLNAPQILLPINHPGATGEILRILLEFGADPNGGHRGGEVRHSQDGYTPLIRAAINGNEEDVRLLLRYGADPRLTVRGFTARGFIERIRPYQRRVMAILEELENAWNTRGDPTVDVSREVQTIIAQLWRQSPVLGVVQEMPTCSMTLTGSNQ